MTLKDYIEQYKTAIEARNFHYKNFSTWTAYFSVIVGALFVAFYSVKDDCCFSVLVALIGFVVSLCWHWSNKGYTYWWHHWSLLLDDMEKKISEAYNKNKTSNIIDKINENVDVDDRLQGRVYSVFYGVKGNFLCPTKPANISTSKVALLISFIIAVAWFYLVISNYECLQNLIGQSKYGQCWTPVIEFVISAVITWIIAAVGGLFFQSNICNHIIVKEDGLFKFIENNKHDEVKNLQKVKSGFLAGEWLYNFIFHCRKYKIGKNNDIKISKL